MITITYLRVVLSRKVIDADKWHKALETVIIPELKTIDVDEDGTISIAELLRTAKRIILTALM